MNFSVNFSSCECLSPFYDQEMSFPLLLVHLSGIIMCCGFLWVPWMCLKSCLQRHFHISLAIESMFEQALLWCCFLWRCTLHSCLMFSVHLNPSHAAVHLSNNRHQHLYLLPAVCQKSKIDSLYITSDKYLIPYLANRSLGAFDKLFKVYFLFNLSYDSTLVNVYTFLHNINVWPESETREPDYLTRQ